MFAIRFIKTQPTTYLLKYVRGKLKSEGQGLALFYFAPTTSLVAVPMESGSFYFQTSHRRLSGSRQDK